MSYHADVLCSVVTVSHWPRSVGFGSVVGF